jgi:hypothetical protein
MGLQEFKDFLKRNQALRLTLKRNADNYVNEAVSKMFHLVQASPLGSLPPTSSKLGLLEKYTYEINEAVSRENIRKAKAVQLREALRLQDEGLATAKAVLVLKPSKSNTLSRLKSRLISVEKKLAQSPKKSASTLTSSPLENKQTSSHKGLALGLISTREDAIIAAYTGRKKSLKDIGDRYSISPLKIRRAAKEELRSLKRPELRRKPGLIEVRHAVLNSSKDLKVLEQSGVVG